MIVLQENKVTSEMEGDRTNKEAESLVNIKIPSDDPNKPDIEIVPDVYPTLIGQFLAFTQLFRSHINNGTKLGVAPVAHAPPLFLPRPELKYIYVLHTSAPPRTYLVPDGPDGPDGGPDGDLL